MRTVKVLNKIETKENDTATTYRFNLYDDLNVVDLNNKTVDISVANSAGFVGVVVPKVANPNITLDLSNNILSGLPAGTYSLEINVRDNDGKVAKYPTAGYINYVVTPDLVKTVDAMVPQITLDSVLESIDEKLDVIKADGLKGDKGEQGLPGVDGANGINGIDGKDGTNGSNGKDGKNGINGLTLFMAWADSMDGAKGFSQSDYNKAYAGISYATEASDNPADYKWAPNGTPNVPASNVIGAFDYILIQSADGTVWRQSIDNDGRVTLTKQ